MSLLLSYLKNKYWNQTLTNSKIVCFTKVIKENKDKDLSFYVFLHVLQEQCLSYEEQSKIYTLIIYNIC